MKRFLIAMFLVLVSVSVCLAATTVTRTDDTKLGTVEYTIRWIATTGTITIPSATVTNVQGDLMTISVSPSYYPTNLYDVTLKDVYGVDVLNNKLQNLSASIPARFRFTDSPNWMNGEDLTFALANNSVTNAAGWIVITTKVK